MISNEVINRRHSHRNNSSNFTVRSEHYLAETYLKTITFHEFLKLFCNNVPLSVHIMPIVYVCEMSREVEQWFYTDNSQIVRNIEKDYYGEKSGKTVLDRFTSLSLEQQHGQKSLCNKDRKICYLLQNDNNKIILTQYDLSNILKNHTSSSLVLQQYIESSLGEDICIKSTIQYSIKHDLYETKIKLGRICYSEEKPLLVLSPWRSEVESTSLTLLRLINDKLDRSTAIDQIEFIYILSKKQVLYLSDITYCTIRQISSEDINLSSHRILTKYFLEQDQLKKDAKNKRISNVIHLSYNSIHTLNNSKSAITAFISKLKARPQIERVIHVPFILKKLRKNQLSPLQKYKKSASASTKISPRKLEQPRAKSVMRKIIRSDKIIEKINILIPKTDIQKTTPYQIPNKIETKQNQVCENCSNCPNYLNNENSQNNEKVVQKSESIGIQTTHDTKKTQVGTGLQKIIIRKKITQEERNIKLSKLAEIISDNSFHEIKIDKAKNPRRTRSVYSKLVLLSKTKTDANENEKSNEILKPIKSWKRHYRNNMSIRNSLNSIIESYEF